MATLNKNFKIKNGLIVEGSTATVNGNDILVKNASDQYIIDLIGGETLVLSVDSSQLQVDGNGQLSVKSNVFDTYGAASSAQSAAESYADTAASNAQSAAESYADTAASNAQSAAESYADTAASNAQSAAQSYADTAASNAQSAAQSYADGLAVNYDAAGAASNAEASANTYTDNAINALDTDDIEEGTTNKYFSNTLARGAVSAGTGLSYDSGTGEFSVDGTIATESYVDTAVSNLVNGAPALLDTLNELAAAIGDDENFVTTVTTSIGEKVAKAGDTMTGALTLNADPINNLHAATKQYVDAAESAAQSAAESTAQGYVDDLKDGTTDFTAVDVNSVSRQIAATTGNVATAGTATAIFWSKNEYRTAKILLKAKNGSHTHVSELIVTLDTSDNIALNEYAITTTNGSLMDVTADININDVRIRVTTANNNTEVMAHATLLV